MITSINKLENFGCYEKYIHNATDIPDFGKVNIIYGNNGSGKTTLSNLFYLLSKHCKEKQTVFKEYIEEGSSIELAAKDGKITEKNVLEKNLDLYVFNSKFISDHVFNGNTANIESFSSDIKLTNEEINIIDKRLQVLTHRQSKIQSWQNKLDESLSKCWDKQSKVFQKKINNARLTNLKPQNTDYSSEAYSKLEQELTELYRNYEKKSKEQLTIERYENLNLEIEEIRILDIDIQGIKVLLQKSIKTEAKDKLKGRINDFQKLVNTNNYSNVISDLNSWYRTGGRLLFLSQRDDKTCPLCFSDLSETIDDAVDSFVNYFSDEVVKAHEQIDSLLNKLDSLINGKVVERNNSKLSTVKDTCNGLGVSFEYDERSDTTKLNKQLLDLSKTLKEKKLNIEKLIILTVSEYQLIEDYNLEVSRIKNEIGKGIEKELKVLGKKTLQEITNDIKAKLKKTVIIEYNLPENNIFSLKKESNAKIAAILANLSSIIISQISTLQIKRAEEISKLNAESKYVNIYLSHLGINHFSIYKEDKDLDNVIITFSKTGKKKTKLSHSLSEGEKTALAFAYFISKIRVERIESNDIDYNKCIVVIDDPISSLDDNRLFQTANLIESFFFYNSATDNQICQLFLFSHNLTFLKYIYTALKTNDSLKKEIKEYCLYYENPKIRKIPSSLKNFTNTYLVKLKNIIDFKENKVEYDTAKNYLPNFIRIVLETFLSFKLALVDDGNKMPGLSYLINTMVKELNEIEDKTIDNINKEGLIARLNYLRKISDHESHGNISRAEGFNFISEDELKQFTKYTLQTIGYIDSLHFRRAKSHT
ncbi:AAA family ATPase [Adhaeribacter soli]|uniref:AAA family ATPase n=1 Tax=Adhaeribacter soli TaxID=2607655 RepID=A0A5N1IUE5_9BACT|nr:AAA family ATPase [Adhaeribacter soli]KAA9333561.1 AAA family ATPase [Adhaeribacter soli]